MKINIIKIMQTQQIAIVKIPKITNVSKRNNCI